MFLELRTFRHFTRFVFIRLLFNESYLAYFQYGILYFYFILFVLRPYFSVVIPTLDQCAQEDGKKEKQDFSKYQYSCENCSTSGPVVSSRNTSFVTFREAQEAITLRRNAAGGVALEQSSTDAAA